MKLYDAVNNVLRRLDDYPTAAGEREWTREEIELYVRDGYDAFCRRTKCIWDIFYPENLPTPGSHVGKWEENYFLSGMLATGLINFSGGHWEQDYAEPGAIGPINHTMPWESEYLEDVFIGRQAVPEDNVAVERGTFDWTDIDPEYSRWFEEHDRNFQTITGDPQRFAMDRDGIGYTRVVPAGSGAATSVSIREPWMALRAYWTLDESSGVRMDSVGNAHLTPSGSPGSVAAQISNGATFTAGSSHALVGSTQVDLDGESGITVHYWVYVPTGAPTNATFLFNGAFFTSYMHLSTSNANALQQTFLVNNDEGEASQVYVLLPSHDEWHFIAAKYDPDTMKVSIRVNAGSWTEAASGLTSSHPTIDTDFGTGSVRLGGITSSFSTSSLDEVAIYNAVLSDAALLDALNLTRPDFDPPSNGLYGLLRTAADTDGLGAWAPVGSWGGLTEIPEHFPMGGQYGIPRRLYSDVDNSRFEYFRLGRDPSVYQFEIPKRFVKYVEHYAESKALERDGPGQDLALSGHFMQRFEDGVNRMVKRLGEHKRARGGTIGSAGRVPRRPGLARLPYQYGRQIRRGY